MPKVSIIVPVFNVEKYIGRCIVSVQQQTMADWELILIDDCSPDNSYSVVKQYADKDSRIKILRHNENHGPMIARRWGDMFAKGDYIAYCDGDDYLPNNALETLYNEAIRTDADIVSGDYIYVTTDGKEVYYRSRLQYGTASASVLKSLLRNEYKHTLWGKFFKRALLQDYEYQTYEHATNGEDGILFYQLLVHTNSIVHVNTNEYYYCQNMESSTQRRLNDNAIRSICLLNQIRVQVTFSYPKLEEDLNRLVTNILCGLYAKGYHHDAKLDKYIHEFSLDEYVSWRNIVKYLDYSSWLRTFISYKIRAYIKIIKS